ncbi:MAG TPA: DUF6332 family protein [Kineosporiaceae bacterium]
MEIDGPALREARIVEIGYALLTTVVPGVLIVGAVVAVGRWTGLNTQPLWNRALLVTQLAVAVASCIRVVLVLVRFERRQRRAASYRDR